MLNQITTNELLLVSLKELVKVNTKLSTNELFEKIYNHLKKNKVLSKKDDTPLLNRPSISVLKNKFQNLISHKNIEEFVEINKDKKPYKVELKENYKGKNEKNIEIKIKEKDPILFSKKLSEKEIMAISLKKIIQKEEIELKDLKKEIIKELQEKEQLNIIDIIKMNGRSTLRLNSTIDNLTSHQKITKYITKKDGVFKLNKNKEETISDIKEELPFFDISLNSETDIKFYSLSDKELNQFRILILQHFNFPKNKEKYILEKLSDKEIKKILKKYDNNIEIAKMYLFENPNKLIEQDIKNIKEVSYELTEKFYNPNIPKIIFGDSDSDGTCYLSNMKHFLNREKLTNFYLKYHKLQKNVKTSHGLTFQHLNKVIKEQKIDTTKEFLVKTGDSTINNLEECELILQKYPNIKLYVTDHHLPDHNSVEQLVEKYPNIKVVNPLLKYNNEKFETNNISGSHVGGEILQRIINNKYGNLVEIDKTLKQLKNKILLTSHLGNYLDLVNTKPEDSLSAEQVKFFSSVGPKINTVNYFNFITTTKIKGFPLEKEKEVDLLKKQIDFFLNIDYEELNMAELKFKYIGNMESNKIIETADASELRPLFVNLNVKKYVEGVDEKENFILEQITNIYKKLRTLGLEYSKLLENEYLNNRESFEKRYLSLNTENDVSLNIIKPTAPFGRKFIRFMNLKDSDITNKSLIINVKSNKLNTNLVGSLRFYDKIEIKSFFTKIEKTLNQKGQNIIIKSPGHKFHASGFSIESKDNTPIDIKTTITEIQKEYKRAQKKLLNNKTDSVEIIEDVSMINDLIDLAQLFNSGSNSSDEEKISFVLDISKLTTKDKTLGIEKNLLETDLESSNYLVSYPYFDKSLVISTDMIKKVKESKDKLGISFSILGDNSIISNKVVNIENAIQLQLEKHKLEEHTTKQIEISDEELKKLPFVKHLPDKEKLEWIKKNDNTIVEILGSLNQKSFYSYDVETTAEDRVGAFGEGAFITDIGFTKWSFKEEKINKLTKEELENNVFFNYKSEKYLLPNKYEVLEKNNMTEITKKEYNKLFETNKENLLYSDKLEKYYRVEEQKYKRIDNIYEYNGEYVINRELKKEFISFLIDVTKEVYSTKELQEQYNIKEISNLKLLNKKENLITDKKTGKHFTIPKTKEYPHSFQVLENGKIELSFDTIKSPLALTELTNIKSKEIKEKGWSIERVEEQLLKFFEDENQGEIFSAFNNKFDTRIIKQLPKVSEHIKNKLNLDSAYLSRTNNLSSDQEYFVKLDKLNLDFKIKTKFANNYLTDYSFEELFEQRKSIQSVDEKILLYFEDNKLKAKSSENKYILIEDVNTKTTEELYEELKLVHSKENSKKYSVVKLFEQNFLNMLREYNERKSPTININKNILLGIDEDIDNTFLQIISSDSPFNISNIPDKIIAKYGYKKIIEILLTTDNKSMSKFREEKSPEKPTITKTKKYHEELIEKFKRIIVGTYDNFFALNKEEALRYSNAEVVKRLVGYYNKNEKLMDLDIISQKTNIPIDFLEKYYKKLKGFDKKINLSEYEELHNNASAINGDSTVEMYVTLELLRKKLYNPIDNNIISPSTKELLKGLILEVGTVGAKEIKKINHEVIENSYSYSQAKNISTGYNFKSTNPYVSLVEPKNLSNLTFKFNSLSPETYITVKNKSNKELSQISKDIETIMEKKLLDNTIENIKSKIDLNIIKDIGVLIKEKNKLIKDLILPSTEKIIEPCDFYTFIIHTYGVKLNEEELLKRIETVLEEKKEEKRLQKMSAKKRIEAGILELSKDDMKQLEIEVNYYTNFRDSLKKIIKYYSDYLLTQKMDINNKISIDTEYEISVDETYTKLLKDLNTKISNNIVTILDNKTKGIQNPFSTGIKTTKVEEKISFSSTKIKEIKEKLFNSFKKFLIYDLKGEEKEILEMIETLVEAFVIETEKTYDNYKIKTKEGDIIRENQKELTAVLLEPDSFKGVKQNILETYLCCLEKPGYKCQKITEVNVKENPKNP